MTACVNKKHSRRVAAAVSASLVGALTLGAAPAVVMAQEAGVETLEATPQSSAEDGAIVAFEDGLEAGATFVANDKQQGLVPTAVQPWGVSDESAQLEVSSYIVYKLCDATDRGATPSEGGRKIDGKDFYFTEKLTNQLPTEIGNYAVFAKVKVEGAEVSVKAGATFSITAASLEDATLYQVNADETTDVSDTEFVFNTGNWQLTGQKNLADTKGANRLALVSDGVQLSMDSFKYDYYTKAGKPVTGNDIVAAGDYYVIVSGKDDSPYAAQKKRFDFTVSPYDLATANIVAADVALKAAGGDQTSSVVTFDGQAYTGSWLDTYTTVDYPDVATKLGEASLTVNVDEAALQLKGWAGSIINSQDVNYNVVNALVTPTASYGTKEFKDFDLAVDFSADPTNAFDASKVTVTYTDPKTGKEVETDKYTLRVVNTKTQEVGDESMLTAPGAYTVQAVLDSSALGYDVAGKSDLMDVTVTKGVIDITDIAFAYKGQAIKTVDELKGEYIPGYDFLKDITVTVKTANGEVPASDYKIVVTKDGKEADAIEDAGAYKVEVVADGYTYDADENFINVAVAKRNIAKVSVRAKDTFNYTEMVWDAAKDEYVAKDHRVLPYTGEEISATYEWSCDGGKTWYEFPAADVNVSYKLGGKKADLLEVGTYDAVVAADKDSANYENSKQILVEVSDKKVYSDVPNGIWYSQPVYDAAKLGYMTGFSGTQLFGPEASITRGQVACVLFNMAGADKYVSDNDFHYTEGNGYVTGFSDVDGNAYYAKAIAWAKATGVVNGYQDGTFHPDQAVSVQEFACMLANYAKKTGDDMSFDVDLADYAGGDQVADFAKDSVAWAVENGIMGNNGADLAPTASIMRCRVAAMAVNYQPNGAPDVIIK